MLEQVDKLCMHVAEATSSYGKRSMPPGISQLVAKQCRDTLAA